MPQVVTLRALAHGQCSKLVACLLLNSRCEVCAGGRSKLLSCIACRLQSARATSGNIRLQYPFAFPVLSLLNDQE